MSLMVWVAVKKALFCRASEGEETSLMAFSLLSTPMAFSSRCNSFRKYSSAFIIMFIRPSMGRW